MKLKNLTNIQTNFESADFWIQRKGSINTIGKPTKEYNKENIGIQVLRTDKILPEFLFYLMEYVYSANHWQRYATGSTDMKNLRIEDVKNLELQDKQ